MKREELYTARRDYLLPLLREIRREAGLTQTELAARIGKDQTFISKCESGERRVDVIELRDICRAVGITLEQFAKKLEESLK